MTKRVGNSISGRRSRPIRETEMTPITTTMATIMVTVTRLFTENSDRVMVFSAPLPCSLLCKNFA
jgi:hypothetical protein